MSDEYFTDWRNKDEQKTGSDDYIVDKYERRRREKLLDGYELDRSPSNGSDDRFDKERDHRYVSDSNRIGSPSETFFRSGEVCDEKKERYERQYMIDQGLDSRLFTGYDGERRRGKKRRWQLLRTIGTQLDLTDFQLERAEQWLNDFDFSRSGTVTEEAIVLAVISLSARCDDRLVDHEGDYIDIRKNLSVSLCELQTARRQVWHQCDVGHVSDRTDSSNEYDCSH